MMVWTARWRTSLALAVPLSLVVVAACSDGPDAADEPAAEAPVAASNPNATPGVPTDKTQVEAAIDRVDELARDFPGRSACSSESAKSGAEGDTVVDVVRARRRVRVI